MISSNTAQFVGGEFMSIKLNDVLNPIPKEETEDPIIESAEEYAAGIWERMKKGGTTNG